MGKRSKREQNAQRVKDTEKTSFASGTIALADQLRRNVPGMQTANRLEQSTHYRGVIYIAIRSMMDALLSSTIQLNKKHRRYARSSLRRQEKALPTPHANSEDEQFRPFDDPDHSLVKLIDQPNRTETFNELLAQLVMQYQLTGSGLMWGNPNKLGLPAELYILPTALCYAQPPQPNYPEGWWRVAQYYPAGGYGILPSPIQGGGAPIDGRDVFVFKNPHPLWRWDAWSPLSAGSVQLDILESIDQARWTAMDLGLTPDMVLLAPGVNQNQLDAYLERLKHTNIGKRNFRKVMAIGGDQGDSKFDVKFPAIAPRDMDFGGGWDQMTAYALALFGVPKSVAGLATTGSYAELYAALKQFHTLTLRPLVARLGVWLTRHLARIWGKDLAIQLDLPTIDDQQLLEQQLGTDLAHDGVTYNEYRALRGRKAVPGGDVLPSVYVMQQQTRAQMMLQASQGPPPGQPGDPNSPSPNDPGAQQAPPGAEQLPPGAEPLAGAGPQPSGGDQLSALLGQAQPGGDEGHVRNSVAESALQALGVPAGPVQKSLDLLDFVAKAMDPNAPTWGRGSKKIATKTGGANRTPSTSDALTKNELKNRDPNEKYPGPNSGAPRQQTMSDTSAPARYPRSNVKKPPISVKVQNKRLYFKAIAPVNRLGKDVKPPPIKTSSAAPDAEVEVTGKVGQQGLEQIPTTGPATLAQQGSAKYAGPARSTSDIVRSVASGALSKLGSAAGAVGSKIAGVAGSALDRAKQEFGTSWDEIKDAGRTVGVLPKTSYSGSARAPTASAGDLGLVNEGNPGAEAPAASGKKTSEDPNADPVLGTAIPRARPVGLGDRGLALPGGTPPPVLPHEQIAEAAKKAETDPQALEQAMPVAAFAGHAPPTEGLTAEQLAPLFKVQQWASAEAQRDNRVNRVAEHFGISRQQAHALLVHAMIHVAGHASQRQHEQGANAPAVPGAVRNVAGTGADLKVLMPTNHPRRTEAIRLVNDVLSHMGGGHDITQTHAAEFVQAMNHLTGENLQKVANAVKNGASVADLREINKLLKHTGKIKDRLPKSGETTETTSLGGPSPPGPETLGEKNPDPGQRDQNSSPPNDHPLADLAPEHLQELDSIDKEGKRLADAGHEGDSPEAQALVARMGKLPLTESHINHLASGGDIPTSPQDNPLQNAAAALGKIPKPSANRSPIEPTTNDLRNKIAVHPNFLRRTRLRVNDLKYKSPEALRELARQLGITDGSGGQQPPSPNDHPGVAAAQQITSGGKPDPVAQMSREDKEKMVLAHPGQQIAEENLKTMKDVTLDALVRGLLKSPVRGKSHRARFDKADEPSAPPQPRFSGRTIAHDATDEERYAHDLAHGQFADRHKLNDEAHGEVTNEYYDHLAAHNHPLRKAIAAYGLQRTDPAIEDAEQEVKSGYGDPQGTVGIHNGGHGASSLIVVRGNTFGKTNRLEFQVDPMGKVSGARRTTVPVYIRSRRDLDSLLSEFPPHVRETFHDRFPDLPLEHPHDLRGMTQAGEVDYRSQESTPEDYYAAAYSAFVAKTIQKADPEPSSPNVPKRKARAPRKPVAPPPAAPEQPWSDQHAATRKAFEDAIDANPLEATNHLVYADHLDESGEHDEAAFRRSMGAWLQSTPRHFPVKWSDDYAYPWTVMGSRLPKGVVRDNIQLWDERHQSTVNDQETGVMGPIDPYQGRSQGQRWGGGGTVQWKTYHHMEEALRRAFMAGRKPK